MEKIEENLYPIIINTMNINNEDMRAKIKKLKSAKDAHNFVKELVGPVLEEMLKEEMTEHLGYTKHSVEGNGSGNSRNGYSKKKIKGNYGESEIEIPRDRNGKFEPKVMRKYETIDNEFEEKIISMYGKGMSTRDISYHVEEIYGASISATSISNITDKIMPLVKEWQNRPLNKLYCVTYLDGIHFKVREGGKVVSKCAYIILGITEEGKKEVLGIYLGENEGAKFWLQVLTELKHRGLEDILICCIDGLQGFSDAIKTVYPQTEIQQCIIHQIRNTTKYIPHKDRKKFCADLKKIYSAVSKDAGHDAIAEVEKNWPRYAPYLQSWKNKWEELSAFFQYAPEIRKIIYTNNAIESLNRQIRKVTKTSGVFPHEESLLKILFLAQKDISKKWTMTIPNWGTIAPQLAIHFPDRFNL